MAKNIDFMGATFPDVPSIRLPQHEGGLVSFDDTSDGDIQPADVAQGKIGYAQGQRVVGTAVAPTGSQTFTENGTFDVASIAEAVINVAGGGGGIGTLLATKALGTLSTTSTSTVDLEQKLTILNAVDYDLIITEVSVDTPTNNRHLATVSLVYMTASSDIATRNLVNDNSRFLIFKLTSNGATQSRNSSSGYGVFTRVSSASIIDGAINLAISMRYNSTNSGTIDGDYTARAYGVNLYDLIGD